jgi:alkanesulfonate monooxygenase SsuD/methylene tetrahydromethanopterin reductase-like flavin-dependent oxidoreductase (luciferase family)
VHAEHRVDVGELVGGAPADAAADDEEADALVGAREREDPLRFGLKLSQQLHPIAVQREAWRIGDEAGFDHLWPFDHLIALGQDPSALIFDGWTILGAVAEATKRARIGLNVTGNLYRHPGLLAKIAVTVDHLSHGRPEFGIGTGWNEPEFTQFGLPFPSAGDRVRMLDEALRAMKLLWSEPRATFKGRFYELSDAIAEPKPMQRPHPPIWIGSKGERMLRLTARHADVWNSNIQGFDETVAGSRYLDEACRKIGRDPASLRRSINVRLDGADDTLKRVEDARKSRLHRDPRHDRGALAGCGTTRPPKERRRRGAATSPAARPRLTAHFR